MNNKNVFIISLFVLIISVICMGIHRFVTPFSDNAVRVIGVLLLIDLFVLTYSAVKLKNNRK